MELRVPESYLEEEEREGFVISSLMKRSWATKLKMICTMDEILRRHGIQWYADYGSLLGAVRHHGFIPWDDDFDISLMRADYARALEVLEAELPAGYQVAWFGKSNFTYPPTSSINNRRSIDVDDNAGTAAVTAQFFGNPYKDVIDIFPLDFVAGDEEERSSLYRILEILLKVLENYEGIVRDHELEEYIEQIELLTGQALPAGESFLPALCQLITSLESLYPPEGSIGIENIWNMAAHDRDQWRQVSWYDSVVWLPFELIEVPVPSGYMQLLRANFGDGWMTPAKNTAGHGYPFYRNQEKLVEEYWQKKGAPRPDPLGIFRRERERLAGLFGDGV